MISFVKMSVLGNDFVIIDARDSSFAFNLDFVYIADRKRGVGADQVIIIEVSAVADCKMLVYNSDGSFAEACGNGSCSIAALMFDALKKDVVTIESCGAILTAWKIGEFEIKVTLAPPSLDWDKIPLSKECDTLFLPINVPGLWDYRIGLPTAVNVGNPHVVFFCEDVDKVDIRSIGVYVESHPLFPNKTNVSVVEVVDVSLKIRVWERGVGETDACGTAASAAFYAAIKRGCLVSDSSVVHFKSGSVKVSLENGILSLTAVVSYLFSGVLSPNVGALM